MTCPLCEGRRRVRRAGAEEPETCPRCAGEGELPTKQELAELIAAGKASPLDRPFLSRVREIRTVLRKIEETWR